MKNKRILLVIAIISSLVIIAACSDRNKVTETPSEKDTLKESLGETYGFTSFNLAVDTKEMTEAILADYDEKRDRTEALYENKIEDLYLHGDEAMEKLDSLFEELSLEPDMDDEDMIKNTSEAFGIVDYKSLKLKVKFKGHDKKELMMTK